MAANYIVNIIKILKRFKQKIETYFVSKETGKGLSTNDFTDNHKTKLESLPNAEEIAVLDSNDRLPLSNLPSHTHGNSDITDIDASKINSGIIDISRLPQGALERLVIVASQSERYALTKAVVQNGDTVQQLDTGALYIVIDEDNLDNSTGYREFTAGRASAVSWSNVEDKPQSYTPSSHTHEGTDIVSKVSSASNADSADSVEWNNVENKPSSFSPSSHTHGNISNDGKIGSTANLPVITGVDGAIQTGSFGNAANTFCEGNDSRLSDARQPVSHTHSGNDITSEVTNAKNVKATQVSNNNAYDIVLIGHGETTVSYQSLIIPLNDSTASHSPLRVVVGSDLSEINKKRDTDLIVGNAVRNDDASGFSKSRRGRIALFGYLDKYTYIQPGEANNNIVTLPTTTGTLALDSSCDENIKVDLQDVDVLEKLKTIPVKKFHYSEKKIQEKAWKKENPNTPISEMPEFKDNEHEPWYIHVMAKDFNGTFDVDDGNPDTIKPINEIGVCIRAIQELAAEVDELKAKLKI